MRYACFLRYIDLPVVMIALIFSASFVSGSHAILNAIGLNQISTAASYGLVLVVISGACSLSRKMLAKNTTPDKGWKTTVFEILILAGSVLIFANTAGNSDFATNAEIVTPYISYALSVIFCAGIGYIAADFVFNLYNQSRRK